MDQYLFMHLTPLHSFPSLRRLVVVWLCMSTATVISSRAANFSVPGDYGSLATALQNVMPGDTIDVYLATTLSGASVTGNLITFHDVNVTIQNCTFSNSGLRVLTTGAVSVAVNITGNTFRQLRQEGVYIRGDGSASCTANVSGNTVNGSVRSNTWPAIFFLARDSSTMNLTANGNYITNLVDTDAIVARAMRNASTLSGEISGNVIASVGSNAYDRGIWVDVNPSPTPGPRGYVRVNNNNVSGCGGSGLKIRVMNDTNRWQWCSMDMVVTNNVVANAASAGAGEVGIFAEVGTAIGSYGELWLNLRQNTATQGIKLVHGDVKNAGRFVIPGDATLLAQTNNWNAQVHVQSYNTASVTVMGLVRVGGLAADTFTGLEDTNLTCTILTNEYDMRGDRSALRIVSVSSPTYGSAEIRSGSTNILYTPNANFNGSDSFTYTAGNGLDWTSTATVYLRLTPVNDPPEFTKGANESKLEDAGTQTVAGWATAISGGPTADESTQTVWFVSSNNNSRLFSLQPTVTVAGALSYQTAPNSNGMATVWLWLQDNGGTANGGVGVSATQTFTITATPVNDAPNFVPGTNPLIAEDAGLQISSNWATSILAGPSDELAQATWFTVTNDHPGFFIIQPTVTVAGVLSYQTAADSNGTATVSVRLHDDGGIANGGEDTSIPHDFTISVTPVNDAPTDLQLSADTLLENQPTGTVVGVFSTTDVDASDPYEYALVSGVGSADNAYFTATNGRLETVVMLNYEYKGTYNIRVRSTDSGGLFVEKQFIITALDINDAPMVRNNAYMLDEDTVFSTNAPGVLGNDSDEDGNHMTAVLQANVTNGTLTLEADGSFVYQPGTNFYGADSFTYVAVDDGSPAQTSSVATVTLTVNPVIDTPEIFWAEPAPIFYGTPLSEAQLNATADVAGTYTYLPTNGAIVNAGTNLLHVDFTPDDPANFTTASSEVSLVVWKANQTIAFPPIAPQKPTASVGLAATADSGLAVTFSANLPGSISEGTNLTFTGLGDVVLVASQDGNANFNAAPNVTNSVKVFTVTPDNGPHAGGNTIVITNGILSDGADITNIIVGVFGTTNILAQGTNWAIFVAPVSDSAGVKDIVIQSDKVGDTTFTGAYTYNPIGDIYTVEPSGGSYTGGYSVAITGTNIGNGGDITNVTLCDVDASIVRQSSTQVVVTAGAAASVGLGDVRVYSVSFGETVRSNGFTYLMPQFRMIGTNGETVANSNTASTVDGTDFGEAVVGLQVLTNTFSITNSGNTALTISGVTTGGTGAARFSLLNAPSVISVSSVVPFQVVFTPQGGRQEAALNFDNDSSTTPYVFNVAGTGVGGAIQLAAT